MQNNLVWPVVIIICSVILASGVYLVLRDSCLPSCSESTLAPAESDSPSPDSLAKKIQDKGFSGLQEVSQALGIDTPECIFQYGDDRSYEIEQASFSANNDVKYKMLIIAEVPFKWDWQYLLFRTTALGKWAFLGKIDLGTQKYKEPSWRIFSEADCGQSWLIMRSLNGSGTGFCVYEDMWFSLDTDTLELALQHPVDTYEGVNAPSTANVDLEGKVIAHEHEEGMCSIVVQYEISYSYGCPLFSMKQKVCYTWNRHQNRFVLNTERSEATQEQIDQRFFCRGEEFFRYAYDKLIQISKNGSVEQERWLTELIVNIEDRPSKQALLSNMSESKN